jgi:hypothetical protein
MVINKNHLLSPLALYMQDQHPSLLFSVQDGIRSETVGLIYDSRLILKDMNMPLLPRVMITNHDSSQDTSKLPELFIPLAGREEFKVPYERLRNVHKIT